MQTKSDKYFWVRTNKVSSQFVPATLSGDLYYIAGFSFPFRADQLVEIGQEIVWQKEAELKKVEKAEFEKDTVGYWLEQIEDEEVKKKAFNNAKRLDRPASSIPDALSYAFTWLDTSEGGAFWVLVHEGYLEKERGN